MHMKALRWYFIGVVIIIIVLVGIAWFYKGGEHFKGVASIYYGLLLGWLSGAFTAKSVYEKKSRVVGWENRAMIHFLLFKNYLLREMVITQR